METLSKIFESLEKKNLKTPKQSKKQTVLTEKQNKLKIDRINRVVEALNAKQNENRKKTISESILSLKKNIADSKKSKKQESLARRKKFEALIRDAQEEKEEKELKRTRAERESNIRRECGRRYLSRADRRRDDGWNKEERGVCRREGRRCLKNNESGIDDIENAKRRFFLDLEDGSFEETLRERRLRERKNCRESLVSPRFRRR